MKPEDDKPPRLLLWHFNSKAFLALCILNDSMSLKLLCAILKNLMSHRAFDIRTDNSDQYGQNLARDSAASLQHASEHCFGRVSPLSAAQRRVASLSLLANSLVNILRVS